MATLVFDVMTSGQDWSELSGVSQEYLTRFHDKAEAEEKLVLSPLTGQICGLGIYDLERKESVVYVVSTENVDAENFKACTEHELLEDFWEGARSYDVLVTFGGRRFDMPFIYHRTIANKLQPSIDLPRIRTIEKQKPPYHVDLHDELSFHGSLRSPVTLNLLAEAYGLESPDIHGVTGADVSEFHKAGKFDELAEYCERNILVTAELYEIWLSKLAPPEFLNSLQ